MLGKKAQLQFGISSGLLLLGGAYTGERLGRYRHRPTGSKTNGDWSGGVVALGLVSSIGLHKKYDRAVSLYNNQKPKKTSLILSFDATKLAINVRF